MSTNILRRKTNHNAFTKILKKDAKNETEYEESSVTDEVSRYFSIFECGKNLLNILGVTYERECMATQEEEYYTDMLETMI